MVRKSKLKKGDVLIVTHRIHRCKQTTGAPHAIERGDTLLVTGIFGNIFGASEVLFMWKEKRMHEDKTFLCRHVERA